MMAQERPGVMLYFDIEPALVLLDDANRGKLLSSILEYAHYGVVPRFTDPLLLMAWTFVKGAIDRDGERYKNAVHQKRIAGLKSDFKRNYAPKNGIDPDDEDALQEYICQRLSTDVDGSRPTTASKLTATPIPSTNQTTDSISAPSGVGKGSGENQSDRLTEQEFNQRREFFLEQLLGKRADKGNQGEK